MAKTTTLPLHKGYGGPTRRGRVVAYATVLDDEFTRTVLRPKSWYLNNGYARTSVKEPGKKRRQFYLHQLVFAHYRGEVPDGHEVDHHDRNRLNCVPTNLRAITYSHQMHNQNRRRNNTSGHPGVSWSTWKGKWHARIRVRNKNMHLGYFSTIEEAVQVRKKSEIEHYGECFSEQVAS